MKYRILALLFFYGNVVLGDTSFFPETVFDPNRPIVQLSEETRRNVLEALNQANRDALLTNLLNGLVPNRIKSIADETWFDLSGIEVKREELSTNANVSRICLDHARFADVNLSEADFNRALLRFATFNHVNLENATFDDARLQNADFLNCQLSDTSFRRGHFDVSTFLQCVLTRARFDYCQTDVGDVENNVGVEFSGDTMRSVGFQGVNLSRAKFVNTDLTDADFSLAKLTKVEFLDSIIDGIDFSDTMLDRPNLRGAKLSVPLRLVRTELVTPFLGDLDISKVDLTYVRWGSRNYEIGEESQADGLDHSKASQQRALNLYAQAESIYRVLSQQYRQKGYLREFLGFRVRSLEVRRKLLSVDSQGWKPIELILLSLSRQIDNYDTSLKRLLFNIVITIVFFSFIYMTCLQHWADGWFTWYQTNPDGEFQKDEKGKFFRCKSPLLEKHSKGTSNLSRVINLLKIWAISLELSLEAFFKFVEKIIDIPNLVHFFFKKQERPLPQARFARVIFAIEAWCGVGFLFYASRMLILMVGSQ